MFHLTVALLYLSVLCSVCKDGLLFFFFFFFFVFWARHFSGKFLTFEPHHKQESVLFTLSLHTQVLIIGPNYLLHTQLGNLKCSTSGLFQHLSPNYMRIHMHIFLLKVISNGRLSCLQVIRIFNIDIIIGSSRHYA